MAAYAALLPLCRLLKYILYPFEASCLPPTQEIIESALIAVMSLLEVIQDFESSERSSSCCERAKALDHQIRDLVCGAEDTLEAQLYDQHPLRGGKSLASGPNSHPRITLDLSEVNQEIVAFTESMRRIRMEYYENLVSEIGQNADHSNWEFGRPRDNCLSLEYPEEDDEDKEIEYTEGDLQSTSNYRMVGLVDEFIELRRFLLTEYPHLSMVTISGMAGIGKTALTKELYNDQLVSNYFQRRAFVSVGPKYKLKQVMIDILSQLENLDMTDMHNESLYNLREYLVRSLKSKRFLLVFEDVWTDDFYRVFLEPLRHFTLSRRQCRIILTTRNANLHEMIDSYRIAMRYLNEKESWPLLCEKVFGKDSWCPFELKQVGKKIVENCEGLPLAIIAIAKRLAKDQSFRYWKKLSEDENPLSIGTDDQDLMLDVLYSSYDQLSQRLKTCLLYMGTFPQRRKINASNLIGLWIAEGFIDGCHIRKSLETIGMQYLKELASQSVVDTQPSLRRGVKACKLHHVYWHLCVSEARKEQFFQVVNRYSCDSFAEYIKGHRRLCIHNNTLFGIKDAYNSISSSSRVRSLLCTGPQHFYPVPMCFEMRLLRVLDALTIRFYEFPLEVVQLVHLRYLAFTYNGMLHASISQLWNLQFLIVRQHLSIVTSDAPLYLPVEIWNMKELMHLQVAGALLPQPCTDTVFMQLSTILDINAQCLTAAVVRGIPFLKKLGVQIDSSAQDPFCFADHLRGLHSLKSLKCVVVNPKPKSEAVMPPAPSKIFPRGLRKLSLSGFRYPWKYMEEIQQEFDRLEVIKLRNFAFQGAKWEADFSNTALHVLLLEDLDLEDWTFTLPQCPRPSLQPSYRGPSLLIISHCYKLQEIPIGLGVHSNSDLKRIELVEVKPSVVDSAKEIIKHRNEVQVHARCSWYKEGTHAMVLPISTSIQKLPRRPYIRGAISIPFGADPELRLSIYKREKNRNRIIKKQIRTDRLIFDRTTLI